MIDKKIPATAFEIPGRCRWHHLVRVFDLTSGWRCPRCLAEGEPPRVSNITPAMKHDMSVLGITLDDPEVDPGNDPPPPARS